MAVHHHHGTTYGEMLSDALRRHPTRIAFVGSDDVETSYADALSLFERIRSVLADAGVGRGTGVGMLSSNRTDGWLAQWAGVANGGRYTPLHPFGSHDDHAYIALDSGISVLIVDPNNFLERGAELARLLPGVQVFTLGPAPYGRDLLELARSAAPLSRIDPALDPSDTAMIIYTGGTTGKPKGVVQTHRAIIANHTMQLAEWPWPTDTRFLATAPYSHATGWFLLGTLWRGGTVVLRDGFTVPGFLDAVQRYRITMTFAVPTMIYTLLDSPLVDDFDTDSLELIVYGAAPITIPRIRQGMQAFGPIFLQLYGQSEAPNVVTTLLPEDHDLDKPERLAGCGRPAGGMHVKILDPLDAEVTAGAVGELCIRGPLVMDGYHNRPDETAETLRGGWLRTGDLAVRDDEGFIRLVGRSKDLIITGGFNVYPAEVEGVLLTHPSVVGAAVVGLPDDKWGEAVTAFVVVKPGAVVDGAELIELVKSVKGAVQAPKTVRFIDSIPVTGLGKPDKKVLRIAPQYA